MSSRKYALDTNLLKTSIHEDVVFSFRNSLIVRTKQTYQGSITP